MESTGQLLVLLLTAVCLTLVQGHGRLIEPPSRSSMWRLGYHTPINYNDNQLFCGGVGIQYSKAVGGRCGVCGDPWFGKRENEVGGKYATGQIVRKYKVGEVIDITIDLTANHMGYFEFRLCEKDDPNTRATWDCMNKHVLVDDDTGKTKHMVSYVQYGIKIDIRLRLPKNVKCKACVLQWKYNAGNSWGYDKDGKGCVGCGNQEQFYGCADVAVGYDTMHLAEPHGDEPCKYKKVHGEEWQWDCSEKMDEAASFGGDGEGHAVRDSPLLPLYFGAIALLALSKNCALS